MSTYGAESFYRATIRQSIDSTQTVPFTLKVSKIPTLTTGLLTISPNTANEEILEYNGVDGTALTITVVKMGISPSAQALTTNGTDYNNVLYKKPHSTNDSIRADVNHLHIIQDYGNLQTQIDGKVAIAGGTRTGLTANAIMKTNGSGVESADAIGSITPISTDTVLMQRAGDIVETSVSSLQGALAPAGLIENSFYGINDIAEGESLFIETMANFSTSTVVQNISDVTQNTRIEIPMLGNGVAMNTLKLSLKKVGTPTQNINFRIETDLAGSPSGTLFHPNATSTIAPGSLTTSLADTTITLGGSITIPLGIKVWIIMFQGTYASETINNTNYYQIGVSSQYSCARPTYTYTGSVHTGEASTSTSTWTGDAGAGTETSTNSPGVATDNIKIYTITKTALTAWTTCTITQGLYSISQAFSGNIATFSSPVLLSPGAFTITCSGGGTLNVYRASTQSVSDPLITGIPGDTFSVRGITCKKQNGKAYITSSGLLDSILSRTTSAFYNTVGFYPRIASEATSIGNTVKCIISGLATVSGISDGIDYFVGSIEGTISSTQGRNKVVIGKGIGSKLNVGRIPSGMILFLSSAGGVTSSSALHHGGTLFIEASFLNTGTAQSVVLQNSTDGGVTWNTYLTLNIPSNNGASASGTIRDSINVPQSLIRALNTSTASANFFH